MGRWISWERLSQAFPRAERWETGPGASGRWFLELLGSLRFPEKGLE